MENTSQFLFDNTDAKYFMAIKGRAIGPLTAQEVYEKILKAEVGLLHYLWRDGWGDWKRVCDERDFVVLIPQKPTAGSIQAIKDRLARNKKAAAPEAAATPDDVKNYYLYFNGSQYGPFSRNELVHVLKSHKLGRSAYVWMPGWPNWKRLSEVAEFASFLAPAAPLPELEEIEETRASGARTFPRGGGLPKGSRSEKTGRTGKTGKVERVEKTRTSNKLEKHERTRAPEGADRQSIERTKLSIEATIGATLREEAGTDASDKRRAPRRPLVARLFLHNDKEVIIAVCRDISVGGMQVLTDRIPGEVGTHIKLNVSPGDPSKVKGFVAEGEIVRILEDGRGFSFRFRKITEEARKAIEKYISTD
ncbi:MAG: DUF4339 domain-containing protein [Deltaproteobacteria bacterium]|nr:DUF4339 domain-containing protein [Deltaproteobacteria bacterium]